jgi:hypothetical protein
MRRDGALHCGIVEFGAPILVAASADAWDLRRRYKEYDDE